MPIRLLIADSREILRTGVASMLAGSDIEIVGEAADSKETLRQAAKLKPGVVLLDIQMPDGFALLDKLRTKVPGTKVVIFAESNNPTHIARSTVRGVSDYVLKSASRGELLAAIRNAVAGQPPCPTGELARIISVMNSKEVPDEDGRKLTPRQSQVLRHVALGLNNKEISRSLDISIETVKEHMQTVLRGVGVNHRTKAAVWAVQKGMV